ncbi:hypothetical protein [Rhizobium sp. 9140]|uniref:hypothetical protein n=1 Tax=Rhizobium sp. 9140 TaxID=1761900 RepID=UPI0011122E2B|nr:hypothetical protein [Rhizobium sp. 9140]
MMIVSAVSNKPSKPKTVDSQILWLRQALPAENSAIRRKTPELRLGIAAMSICYADVGRFTRKTRARRKVAHASNRAGLLSPETLPRVSHIPQDFLALGMKRAFQQDEGCVRA